MQAMILQSVDSADIRPVSAENAAKRPEKTDETSDSAAAVKDGSSFLSIIQEMLAGAMEGAAENSSTAGHSNLTVKDRSLIPGSEESAAELKDTLLKARKTRPQSTAKKEHGDEISVSKESRNEQLADKKALLFGSAKNRNTSTADSEKRSENYGADSDGVMPQITAAATDVGVAQNAAMSALGQKNAVVQKNGKQANESDTDIHAEPVITAAIHPAAEQPQISVPKKQLRKIDAQSRITVEDLRTAAAQQPQRVETFATGSSSTVDMALYMPDDSRFAADGNTAPQKNGAKNQSFSALLNQSIQNAVPDIVRNGAIILKDNNQGSIRLTLHPDSLGTVKITLKISENQVTGHIVTASEESFEAFKTNIHTLETAFAEQGFESAGFDLGYSSHDGNQSNQQQDSGFGVALTDKTGTHRIGRVYSESEISAAYSSPEHSLINVVA